MSYAILTDSGSNLNEELLEKYNIDMISFNNLIDDKIVPCFNKDEGYKTHGKEFYDMIREGKFIKTSLISPQTYYDFFKKHLELGEDVLYISISSGISGTYNSACNARDMLQDEYPNQKIMILDSMCASFGQGMSVINASKYRAELKTIEETYDLVAAQRLNIHGEFVVGDLMYLKRTGRISLLTYSIGKLLDIKPILAASKKNMIESFMKVRGRKKALLTLVKIIQDNIINPEEQTIYIAHCDCLDEAKKLGEQIKAAVKCKDVYIEYYDFCTGAHVGPDTIAVFYEGKERAI